MALALQPSPPTPSHRATSTHHPTEQPAWDLQLVLVRDEVLLPGPAHGAEPRVGDVVERRARRDAAAGVALDGVVDEAAGLADPELRGGRLRHGGRKGTLTPWKSIVRHSARSCARTTA